MSKCDIGFLENIKSCMAEQKVNETLFILLNYALARFRPFRPVLTQRPCKMQSLTRIRFSIFEILIAYYLVLVPNVHTKIYE